MLDPKITELADTLIQIQFQERTEQLNRDLRRTADEMTMNGMGTSGPHVQAAYDLCAHDIGLRALIVWQNLQRVLSQTGVLPSETVGDDLKEAVSKHAEAIFAEPHSRLERLVTNIGSSYRPSLTDVLERALKKVHAEIDLYVFGLTRGKESQSAQSNPGLVFNAPVGAVLTGPNATASVFQTITQQDRDALFAAVGLLKKGLASVDELPAHPKEDIVELVEEGELETRKSKPNNSRLLSIFMTVAQAIQTVGSLKPAYDALKTALIPFGVQLP